MGITMEEFGELFDPPASKSIVSRWEKGVSVPNNRRMKRIAELGGVTVADLIIDNKALISKKEYDRLKDIERKYNELIG